MECRIYKKYETVNKFMTGVHFKDFDLRFFQKIIISSNIIKKKLAQVTKMLMISARWYNQYARY